MNVTTQQKPKLPLFRMWIGGAWVNEERSKKSYLWVQFQWFGKTIQKKLFTWKQTKHNVYHWDCLKCYTECVVTTKEIYLHCPTCSQKMVSAC